jgi:hypothetical protein
MRELCRGYHSNYTIVSFKRISAIKPQYNYGDKFEHLVIQEVKYNSEFLILILTNGEPPVYDKLIVQSYNPIMIVLLYAIIIIIFVAYIYFQFIF